jgi:hypothetical protein
MASNGELVQRIRELSDEEAARALLALVEDRGLLPAAEQLPQGTELQDAVDARDVDAYLPLDRVIVTDGELARTALECIPDLREELASTVSDALEYAQSPMERFDPITLPVALLVIAVLQTEIVVKRNESGKWNLMIHKHALRDTALGRVLGALLSQITGGK